MSAVPVPTHRGCPGQSPQALGLPRPRHDDFVVISPISPSHERLIAVVFRPTAPPMRGSGLFIRFAGRHTASGEGQPSAGSRGWGLPPPAVFHHVRSHGPRSYRRTQSGADDRERHRATVRQQAKSPRNSTLHPHQPGVAPALKASFTSPKPITQGCAEHQQEHDAQHAGTPQGGHEGSAPRAAQRWAGRCAAGIPQCATQLAMAGTARVNGSTSPSTAAARYAHWYASRCTAPPGRDSAPVTQRPVALLNGSRRLCSTTRSSTAQRWTRTQRWTGTLRNGDPAVRSRGHCALPHTGTRLVSPRVPATSAHSASRHFEDAAATGDGDS